MDECLKNPQTLLFAMSYFCVYVGTGFWLLVSEFRCMSRKLLLQAYTCQACLS